ncbi:hypothetical protein DFH08DRAFT_805174 [Mycena albidolilacea]|uniref:Uncharacterized protein n=1 Tax=Mycena albidolilacea TaxID=1033008 RepID=A0AAD7EXY9_9AGAR|nr:hypothetical protein DFH08DRAFT_805174 [Mycena albidolilacea]
MNIDEEAIVEHQKSSTELVVYSRLAEKAVTVSCVTEDILGFCHHDSSRCALKNSTQFHEHLQNMSFEVVVPAPSYAPDPELTKSESGGAPDMEMLLAVEWDLAITWFIKSQAERQIPALNSRYFEIDNLYPTRQIQTASMFGANHAIAGPSSIPMDSISAPLHRIGDEEDKYLWKLRNGEGISAEVWDGLVEISTKCGSVFTSSALKMHKKCCLGALIVV